MLVERVSTLLYPARTLSEWHESPGAIERMVAPLVGARLLSRRGNALTLDTPSVRLSWTYTIEPVSDHSCSLIDRIECPEKFSQKSRQLLRLRQKNLADDLAAYARYPCKPLKILVSGASGLIGGALIPFLEIAGHEIMPLTRAQIKIPNSVAWDPQTGAIEKEKLEGFDLVIHLAGENIAGRRWTKAQKRRLFVSRCRDTWLLSQALTRLAKPPKTLVVASACGYYGSRGDEILTEASAPGQGFIADLCVNWEEATRAAELHGIRVIHARFGVGLSPQGGFLAKMAPVFGLGLGAKLGSGKQIMPWIAVDDMITALYHVAICQEISGAVNISSPTPISQKEFAKKLARHLHRPQFLTLPAFILRLLFGEMADELLLASENVYPEKLQKSGYVFRYPRIDDALDMLLL